MIAIAVRVRRFATSPKVAACATAFLLGVHDAYAQDLEAGISEAGTKFKKYISMGLGIASAVIIVLGLAKAGFHFTQKDPSAIWYLAGTIAGGVLFGVGAAVLGK
jgi:hypothetical protein